MINDLNFIFNSNRLTVTKCVLFSVYNKLLSYSKHPSTLMREKILWGKIKWKLISILFSRKQFLFHHIYISFIFAMFTYCYVKIVHTVKAHSQKGNFSSWFMIFYLPLFPAFDCIMISKFTLICSNEKEAPCLDDLWQRCEKKENVGCCCWECVDSG